MRPKRQCKITVSFRTAERFTLLGGWVELWEHGKYLGLIVGLAALERYICRRAGRVFVVRFVQRETDGCLMPIGRFAAEAAEAEYGRPVRFYPLDQAEGGES